MNMITTYTKVGIFIIFATLMPLEPTWAEAAEDTEAARPSMADHLHLKRSKDPVDGGWLPDINGLPNKDQVDILTERVTNVMFEDKDKKCTSINWRLRMMIFQHFAIYQKMANAQHYYFTEEIAHQWAHFLGMIMKESNGDSANITDFKGHTISTFMAKTDLQHWGWILRLTAQTPVQLNHQTNFGLTQSSADRLFVAFKLAKNQTYNTAFLEGREGAATPRKIKLNTAIAIRRLIWFYQDLAQGRISQSDTRIHQSDINKPMFSARYHRGIKTALLFCGTRYLFEEGHTDLAKLEKAMENIAYCKLGNSQAGYGVSELDDKCFAQWVTLCPGLNIDIAIETPLIYFQTRLEPAICEDSFKRLIHKPPRQSHPIQYDQEVKLIDH